MRKDHRGLTLIELLIATAISSIVLIAIATLISYTMKEYKNTSTAVDLQAEAQTTMNLLVDAVMEARGLTISSDGLLLQTPDASEKNFKGSTFLYDSSSNSLYMALGQNKDIINEKYLLSQYITDCTIRVTSGLGSSGGEYYMENPVSVEIIMEFEKNGKTRTVTSLVRCRNQLAEMKLNGKLYKQLSAETAPESGTDRSGGDVPGS